MISSCCCAPAVLRETTTHSDGHKIRRYVCPRCVREFFTHERYVPDPRRQAQYRRQKSGSPR